MAHVSPCLAVTVLVHDDCAAAKGEARARAKIPFTNVDETMATEGIGFPLRTEMEAGIARAAAISVLGDGLP